MLNGKAIMNSMQISLTNQNKTIGSFVLVHGLKRMPNFIFGLLFRRSEGQDKRKMSPCGEKK